jgi:hypothetical protein
MVTSKLVKRCVEIQFSGRIPLCSSESHCLMTLKGLCLRHARRYYASMRFTYVAATVSMAIALLFIAPVVLGASSAHADISGYRRCVGSIPEIPLGEPDPQSLQRARFIEQDLNSGVSPAAEAQKVAQKGFDQRVADAVVQCVMQNNP